MEPFYNVCGIDMGSWNTKVCALVQNNNFQILTNEANFRETPSLVGFSSAQRLIGEAALIKMKSNFSNTIRAPQRYLGLGKRPHLMEQELKNCFVPYRNVNNEVEFKVKIEGEEKIVKSELFVTALFTKIRQICLHHKINPVFSYLSVPSFYTHGERKAIKACAEAANLHNINLVDQWEGFSVQYAYSRFSELKKEHSKNVLFVDFGYTQFGIHACEISPYEIKLIDQEILRFTGSRNMDNFLVDFYCEYFYEQTKINLKQNKKAMVKITDNVEMQRKKLSANNQNHLNIQCIFEDEDLTYNLTREKLEMIVMPVLSQLSSCIQTLKQRLDPVMKIDTIELVGGASRMPFFQQIIRDIFGIQLSKTLNTSEALARGTIIAGCLRTGIIDKSGLVVKKYSTHQVAIAVNYLQNSQSLGKNHEKYRKENTYLIFDKNEEIPCLKPIKMKKKGLIEACLFSIEKMYTKVIGYFQFEAQSLTVGMTIQKIFNLQLSPHSQFKVYEMDEILTDKDIMFLKEQEVLMEKRDKQILQSYEMKNSYESMLYKTKQEIGKNWFPYATPEEIETSLSIIAECQEWVENVHNPSISELKERIETITFITDEKENRKRNHLKITNLYKLLEGDVTKAIEKAKVINFIIKSKQKELEIMQIKKLIDEKIKREAESYWSGLEIKEEEIKNARDSIKKV